MNDFFYLFGVAVFPVVIGFILAMLLWKIKNLKR